MKFLDQARLAQARFADDQRQLALAPTRPLPAPHQHGDFLVPPDKRGEIALPGTAAATTGADEPEQRGWLGHPFERLRAALFCHKQPGDLTLHPRRDQDRAWLGQRLHPRGDIGDVTINLAAGVQYSGPGFKANTGDEFRLGRSGVLAIEFGQSALDGKRRACRALGVVLMRQRIAEQAHQTIPEFFRHMTAHFGNRSGSGIEIGADKIAPFLRIEPCGDHGRAGQITEQYREISTFTGSYFHGRRDRPRRLSCPVLLWR